MFSCEFCEVSKNTFYKEHIWAATSGLPNLLPSSELQATGSVSYAATVYQPRTNLSAILINLFLRFSFAVKSSQRSLASLVFSFFNADESFWTICKICPLSSNCCTLFPLCFNLKVPIIFAFLCDGCCNFFSVICSFSLLSALFLNSKESGLSWISEFCLFLLQLLSIAVVTET